MATESKEPKPVLIPEPKKERPSLEAVFWALDFLLYGIEGPLPQPAKRQEGRERGPEGQVERWES